MRVVVCCGGDREHPRCYNNNYEESANSNSKVVLLLFRRFGMQLLKHRGLSHFLGKTSAKQQSGHHHNIIRTSYS
jgi:hypothetical protein